MAVNLSSLGGAAAQFFDDNGIPLAGGKLHTYAAGTTTPQATYTSSSGSTARTNPIILDAAGRVPGGEIWLTVGVEYKFVVTTSTDVTVATYDNIYAISGFGSPSDAENIIYTPPYAGGVATTVESKLAQIVSVKDFGAVGNGVTDDTTAIQNAVARIVALGGGTLWFEPGKTYYVLPTGGSSGAAMINIANCKGVTIEGNGSKILTGSVTLSQWLFYLHACTDVIIRNLNLESSYATLSSSAGIYWITAVFGTNGIVLENINFKYGASGFTAAGAYAGAGLDSNRVRNINATNLTFDTCYYAMLFQGAGDNFFARGIQTRNAGRSYFAYNVANHDVWLDAEQGGPFSDVLLKVYGSTDWYSRLENIKLNYKSNGRASGAGNQNADEAMIAMDFQLNPVNPAACFIQNIDLTYNVEPNGADKNQSLFIVRKYDASGNADATGSRGHQLINLTLQGTARSCQNLLTDHIQLFTRSGDNWTGEYASNVQAIDFNIGTTNSFNAVALNGAPLQNDGSNCISRVSTLGNLALTNTAGKALQVDQATFDNYEARTRIPQTYTCSWTGASSNPVIGNGTLVASYTVQGKMCTAQIVMTAGSTTTFGSGIWSFSLPFAHSMSAYASLGSALGFRSGVNFYTGICVSQSDAKLIVYFNATATAISPTVPWTWGTNDYVQITLTYPIND